LHVNLQTKETTVRFPAGTGKCSNAREMQSGYGCCYRVEFGGGLL
jgi:hypothetical protein